MQSYTIILKYKLFKRNFLDKKLKISIILTLLTIIQYVFGKCKVAKRILQSNYNVNFYSLKWQIVFFLWDNTKICC